MKNIKFKTIIIGLIFIAITATLIWLFPKTPKIPLEIVKPINLQTNKEQELDVLKKIFEDSSINPQDIKGNYNVIGDEKAERSAVDDTIVKEKNVTLKLLFTTTGYDYKNKIIALYSIKYPGDRVSTAFLGRLYVDILEESNGKYTVKYEKELASEENLNILSDVELEEATLLDINKDGIQEISISYMADDAIGLDKKKSAILQWQGNQFKVIWQQIIHINMDNYGRLLEEDKQNYDATFVFKKSEGDYPDIMVKKTISKDKGIELNPPREEELIYKWDTQKQEYYLWKEEKVGEETGL